MKAARVHPSAEVTQAADTDRLIFNWHEPAITSVDREAHTVIMSVPVSIAPSLRLDRFRKNPLVLFNHKYVCLPVGRSLWERIRYEDGMATLTCKVQFHRDTELSREVWGIVERGLPFTAGIGMLCDDLTEVSLLLMKDHVDEYRACHYASPWIRKAIRELEDEEAKS
jgi:hypothetical protein